MYNLTKSFLYLVNPKGGHISMPYINIEIHGLGIRAIYFEDALDLQQKIFGVFAKKAYFKYIFVTICDDVLVNSSRRRHKSLRIVSVPTEWLSEIIDLLKQSCKEIDWIDVLELKSSYICLPAGSCVVNELAAADLDPEILRG